MGNKLDDSDEHFINLMNKITVLYNTCPVLASSDTPTENIEEGYVPARYLGISVCMVNFYLRIQVARQHDLYLPIDSNINVNHVYQCTQI